MEKFQNLEQLRAAHAIQHQDDGVKFDGENGGSIVKEIPTKIRNDGFLGTLAFAVEKDKSEAPKNKGYYHVFECIAEHLKSLHLLPNDKKTPEDLMNFLVAGDSATLRDITTESLLYMNYLRRFVPSGKDK